MRMVRRVLRRCSSRSLATGVRSGALRQASSSSLYSARHIGAVVELNDSRNQTTVSILPASGISRSK